MATVADAWRPTSELERRLQETAQAGDQESYFRLLADSELLVPVPPDLVDGMLAGDAQPSWPTQEEDGRVHVLAYTSASAMRACLGPAYQHFVTVRFGDIAESWPDERWWLAVDASARGVGAALPIESRLPSWFVRQVAAGDGRPPLVGRVSAPWEELSGQHRDLPRDQAALGRPDPTPQAPGAQPEGEPPAQPPQEPIARAPGEPAAQPQSEPVTQAPREPIAQVPGEPIAQAPGDAIAQAPGEPIARAAAEPIVQAPGEPIVQAPGEPVAKAPGEAIAQVPGEPVAQVPGEAGGEVPRPEFQPANDVERELLRAAANNDHDLFLQTLAGTEVLLPVPDDTDYTLRPGRPGFPWQTRELDGATAVPVFTSPERLIEAAHAAGTGTEYIRLPFTVALRYWPDHDWLLAINSGSPAGGTVLAQQLPGLAAWADQRAAQRMTAGFEPQNDVEHRLFDAARRRDTDAFFKILIGAQVLVPADPDTPWGIDPADPAFPWRPVPVQGRTSIQIFTSLKWMNEAIGSSRFVMPSLADVVAAWPDAGWTLVLNPGTPIDATMPAEQVRSLRGPEPAVAPVAPVEHEAARLPGKHAAAPATPAPDPAETAFDVPAQRDIAEPGEQEPSAPTTDGPEGVAAQQEPQPPVQEPEFEPGNRIDQELYEAASAGDSDAFLRVLMNANVLVPIPDDAPLEVTPVLRDFRWDAALRDEASVQVFTSLVRLREVLPESRFVYADFRELISAWPRAEWTMLLNPGTRIGASLRGDQVLELSEWAARVGLVPARPEVPQPPPQATPPPAPTPHEAITHDAVPPPPAPPQPTPYEAITHDAAPHQPTPQEAIPHEAGPQQPTPLDAITHGAVPPQPSRTTPSRTRPRRTNRHRTTLACTSRLRMRGAWTRPRRVRGRSRTLRARRRRGRGRISTIGSRRRASCRRSSRTGTSPGIWSRGTTGWAASSTRRATSASCRRPRSCTRRSGCCSRGRRSPPPTRACT